MERVLPLFTWREDAVLGRLRENRISLQNRISALPRMSHRRVELQAKLKELTARELAMTLQITGNSVR
ncbi:hypothetical protein [Phyllobacterium leguminum]|uniref:Uncharacterized protein n=1 Tax=Phyllobacterium leguminum TaxID=314237 RepID=A0A318T001_9HYPH|nr:hypothetical protein [Phyllobacterium leguminum]PYE86893.1 hypothetical protein C7477_11831 [Phyllobacterium leguminum]